jgi:hypothetical protein
LRDGGRRANSRFCLNLILACIVYWKAWEISRILSKLLISTLFERPIDHG